MSHNLFGKSPALWSVETLVSHGHQVVTDLARDAGNSSSTMRYLLGRCLLAMERLETYREMGLSSSVHFATQHLKINERSAKTTLSVTKQLEGLPLLAQAVLHAEIEWSQIREVVSVATPETEDMWKKLCIELNCKQIQILVAATPKGGIPGEIASKLPRKTSEYRCRFQPEVVVLIERGLQKMSRKLDKPIMFREAVERFFTEFLADKPYDEAAEKMLEEARKDFLAGRIQQEPLVLKARDVAREFGLLEEVEEDRLGEGVISLSTSSEEPVGFPHLADSVSQAESSRQVGVSRDRENPGEVRPTASLEPLGRDFLSVDETLKTQALQVLGDLEQAIGESFSWEALESRADSSTGSTHVGDSNSIQHEFTTSGFLESDNAELPGSSGALNLDNETQTETYQPGPKPSPTLSEYDDCTERAQEPVQQQSQERTERPTSKVTRLHTPFQGQPPQNHFTSQAPALLNELMAHLKFNQNSRFPTKAQRKALLRRDRYCCRTPGCTNHLFLEIHHIKRYSRGGKTLPQFLVTLCSRCHKNTEEGKLYIRLTETGQLIFTDQNGNDLEQLKRQERAIWLDYWLGWKGRETDSHWARAIGFSESAA